MPFRSAKQQRFLWARYPKIAERWTREYGPYRPVKRGKLRRKRKARD